MKNAKMDWIEEQCQDIDNMKKNNSKKTYQLVKDLTSTKQGRTTTIQDKDGKCLTEEQDIPKRWSVRVLLRAVQLQSHWRPRSTKRPPSNRQRQLPHPSRRSGSSGEITQEGEVSRSGQRPSGAGAGRGRSHEKRPTDYLQQDLADRGVAHAVDPISHHHPPQERQPTAMPELSYHQPHQPPEQSYAEYLAEPTEAAS